MAVRYEPVREFCQREFGDRGMVADIAPKPFARHAGTIVRRNAGRTEPIGPKQLLPL